MYKEVEVPKESFFYVFKDDRYKWIGNESPDLDWWEAHIDFVWDTKEEKTVGFRRTSSYGSPTEFVIFEIEDNSEIEKMLEEHG